jgi:HK97 family phage major capsid protein
MPPENVTYTEEEFKQMTEEAVGKEAAVQVKALLDSQKDTYIKAQMEEQIKAALASMKPTPEDEAVKKAQKGDGGFKTFGEYLLGVYKARHFGWMDPRLVFIDSQGKIAKPNLAPETKVYGAPIEKVMTGQMEKVMTEGTDSAGGFLVFEQYLNQIFELGLEDSIVRQNGAFVIPMTSDTLNVQRIDDTAHTSTVYGGVYGAWTEEAGSKQVSQPAWGSCKLTAHEFSGYTVASNSLMADAAVSLEAIIRRLFGRAWPYFEDIALISGNGVGQPLGFLKSGALITVTRQANNAVRFGDLANIWRQVLPESRKRGIWIINHEVISDLIIMVAENAVPAATAGHVIWINPNQGAANQIPGTILGRPFIESEKVPAIGTEGDIGFYDLSYYLIGDRQAFAIDASTHIYFLNNKTAWRFVMRLDGQPWLQAALTPRNGTRKLSPFVCLSSTS